MIVIKNLFYTSPAGERLFEDISVTFLKRRTGLIGKNGSGKTTLVKLLLEELKPDKGEVWLKTSRVAYLDQYVSFLDCSKSLLENLKHISSMNESEGRNWLAKFLFNQDNVFKKFGVLSGGEKIRAALACVLAKKETPEFLILDEPTNNLDITSIERLESAFSNFKGALLVISHDQTFLENIGVDREIKLN